MNWLEVCETPHLKDLPFKIELDEYGNVVMSPVKIYHSAFQGEIEFLLRTLLKGGRTLPECAVATVKGTKVADVAWVSTERFSRIRDEAECSIAPEICIEVVSGSNSTKEMDEKRALYFQQGAEEFWLCHEDGRMRFYSPEGELICSGKAPYFPAKIVV